MTIIKGYALRQPPKWPYFLAMAVVVLGGFAILIGVIPAEENKPVPSTAIVGTAEAISTSSQATTSSTTVTTATTLPKVTATTQPVVSSVLPAAGDVTRVARIVFASRIGDYNQPTDNLTEVAAGQTGTLYCYTKITCPNPPETVHHVWLAPGGKVFFDIPLTLRNQTADTYSYISLSGEQPGIWELQVRNARGEVLAKRAISVR